MVGRVACRQWTSRCTELANPVTGNRANRAVLPVDDRAIERTCHRFACGQLGLRARGNAEVAVGHDDVLYRTNRRGGDNIFPSDVVVANEGFTGCDI